MQEKLAAGSRPRRPFLAGWLKLGEGVTGASGGTSTLLAYEKKESGNQILLE
jgi:hypothetical protein